jgi:hypothetical protein
VTDSVDAGIGGVKYMTHVNTIKFLHVNFIFKIIEGLIFSLLYMSYEIPWLLSIFHKIVISYITSPAFPSELLPIT